MANLMLQRVIDAGREIRLLNHGNPVEMVCLNRPDGFLNMVTYTLPDNKGGVQFRIYTRLGGLGVVWPKLSVSVWPIPLFQEKVLPGELLYNGLLQQDGFLDPPTNIIPFEGMIISTHPPNRSIHTIQLSLVGDDNIYAGVRLLLNKIAFAE